MTTPEVLIAVVVVITLSVLGWIAWRRAREPQLKDRPPVDPADVPPVSKWPSDEPPGPV